MAETSEPMLLRTYTPRPPLSDFVQLLWLYDGYKRLHDQPKERLLPDGSMELVINLRGDDDRMRVYDRRDTDRYQSFRGALLCGVHSNYFVIDSAEETSVIGVHFKPGGGFPFFCMPADELHNVHVGLDTLWGSAAIDLRDQLLEARSPENQFCILENALLRQAARLTRHRAVGLALKEFQSVPHTQTIAEVTQQIGLSARRFTQLFREEVGLTPKLFCRVRRFQSVLRLVANGQKVDWPDVALACGYFDQAHFIHDFGGF